MPARRRAGRGCSIIVAMIHPTVALKSDVAIWSFEEERMGHPECCVPGVRAPAGVRRGDVSVDTTELSLAFPLTDAADDPATPMLSGPPHQPPPVLKSSKMLVT